MDVREKIEGIIAAILQIDPETVRQIPKDDSLSTIGMDSINCVEIVIAIEEAFEIAFNDEELLLDNLNTINKLSGIALEKQSAHAIS